jgi:probable HAF family extracellular repeat protein
VVWKKNGTFVELSEPGVPVTGVSINNRGEVAGDFSGAGVFTPLVWDHKGTLKSLSSFGGGASSINAKSEVAGFNIVGIEDNSDQRAVVWDRNGTATVLPPPSGDTRAAADGINQLGEVVGYSWTGSFVDTTAVVWDQDGNPTALPPLGGDTESMASGINKHGVVVGVSLDDNGNRTAVVWEWCGGDSC